MLAEIKLTVTENSKIVETITKQTGTQPAQLLKSVEEFQQLANKVMTTLVKHYEQTGGGDLDLEEADEDDVDDDAEVTPRKKKK